MDQIFKIEKSLKTELTKKGEDKKEGNEFNFTFN